MLLLVINHRIAATAPDMAGAAAATAADGGAAAAAAAHVMLILVLTLVIMVATNNRRECAAAAAGSSAAAATAPAPADAAPTTAAAAVAAFVRAGPACTATGFAAAEMLSPPEITPLSQRFSTRSTIRIAHRYWHMLGGIIAQGSPDPTLKIFRRSAMSTSSSAIYMRRWDPMNLAIALLALLFFLL